ncbi:L,D-transpeptidase family protein [Pararhizobium haloflavum]|uniref:L,D-transpeptidase family protein n=1 Tax=Pararhizobium haloflavum TaxID=2037914 RepID=UPI000C19AE08|nr:L,D-transpeptidase family protein [Pararhizobium haloflavum]
MSKQSEIERLSRRAFLSSAAAVGATAIAGAAHGQTVLDTILSSPRRGHWDDQFDARGTRAVEQVSTRVPTLSAQTLQYAQGALVDYQQIVQNGGWNTVPAVNKLQLGVDHPDVTALRRRLMVSGDLPLDAGMSSAFDTYVDGAVKRFQARHGLPPDGVMGELSYAALNVPADIRLGQLETNVVRLQSMAGDLGQRHVTVNIPAAHIEAVQDGRVASRHTAVVGKIDRQTPILNSEIHEVILNPTWTAPRSIIEKDIMPLMRKDPNYLTDNNIRLFDGQGNEVPPSSVDWNAAEAPDLMFRQDPGKINAMASTKINFHNAHAVYMHDTPQQNLFFNEVRFDSSGCVRVQNVRDLSLWILQNNPDWDRQRMEQVIASREITPIAVNNPVPVYFTYVTAWATSDRVVQFRDDIYQRDGAPELAMQEG